MVQTRPMHQVFQRVQKLVFKANAIGNAADRTGGISAAEILGDASERIWFEECVGIEKDEEFAFGHSSSEIASYPEALLREHNEPMAMSACQSGSAIGATICDDKDLEPTII